MSNIIYFFSKVQDFLFSTKAAAVYMLLFAFAIGAATFIENDFGTSAAQKVIFKSYWFELLLILFGICILVNIHRFRLIPQKKWASLIFHSAIILIIIGAGVTRYFGYEGMMHIRENKSSNEFISAETYLNFKLIMNGKSYSFEEPVLFASLGKNSFKKSYQIGDKLIETELLNFIPNPVEQMVEDPDGTTILKVVVGGARGREEYHVKQGDKLNLGGTRINFSKEEIPGYVNIIFRNDSLLFKTDQPITQMVMATQKLDTLYPDINYWPLKTRSLYSLGSSNFVIGEFAPSAKLITESKDPKVKNESMVALQLNVSVNNIPHTLNLLGRKGEEGEAKFIETEDFKLGISYGSKIIKVPFSIKLNDFILDRYPGTDNPSSYASEVTLNDPADNYQRNQRIYMNHVLDYKGYRFFQSSFDQDELGTYLSVNHDMWGTWISYIGYILLTLGLLLIFFLPKTRFAYLMSKLKELEMQKTFIIISIFLTFPIHAELKANPESTQPIFVVSKDHAEKLGKIVVQDFEGRFKPFNTLANEVLRKLSKKEQLFDHSAEEIFISMILSPESWERVPIIQTGNHPEVLKTLGVQEGLTSYRSFFNDEGSYKLKEFVRSAQAMNPKDHGTLEKAVIKLDEKVNIANMVFSARLLKILPVINDPKNTWASPADTENNNNVSADFVKDFFKEYAIALTESFESRDWSKPDELLNKLTDFQKSVSASIMPSDAQIKTELWLNKLKVFSVLLKVYGFMGLILLVLFIFSVFNQKVKSSSITKIAFYILLIAFVFHTSGLGMRWYVSGHAPWSNGYESMIYIAWTTLLAGLIFSRKSIGGLTATCILAATILLVASMSWLDPEITPLVPVLKSYWLTIHVSMEAGSYGFLMLGAVIGMLNLLLMTLANSSNSHVIKRSIQELTIVSEITITGGLIMVSIGTYLGGVWANESWGRYWGWDAKETWALVTILVYAFILHMRFIPTLQSMFAYNFASLFGFATVIMTYYGVNYYLSGLHSYAAGDPVPIPPVVYYTSIALGLLSLLAYVNYKRKFKNGFMI